MSANILLPLDIYNILDFHKHIETLNRVLQEAYKQKGRRMKKR